MDLTDTYQDTSLATQYDFACFRLSVTFTLASLYSSGITFSSKYLCLGGIYDLIDVFCMFVMFPATVWHHIACK